MNAIIAPTIKTIAGDTIQIKPSANGKITAAI
jgi:hypothetical protein